MKMELWTIGKTAFTYIEEGVRIYDNRIKRYQPFKQVVIPDIKGAKKMNTQVLKIKEGELVLKKLEATDYLVLLEQGGKELTSTKLANWLQSHLNQGTRRIIFLVAGAHGASGAIKRRANFTWSMSALTFSHQMIRLFIVEQIYRGISILNGHPYHNE